MSSSASSIPPVSSIGALSGGGSSPFSPRNFLPRQEILSFGKNCRSTLGFPQTALPPQTPSPAITIPAAVAASVASTAPAVTTTAPTAPAASTASAISSSSDFFKYSESQKVINVELVKQVALGVNHAIILLQNNKIYVSGNNERGQLGLGETVLKILPITKLNSDLYNNKLVSRVYAGQLQSLILTETGEVYVFGNNLRSQLVIPHTKSKCIFKPTLLDPKLFDGQRIKGIGIGVNHTLFLTQDGDVYGAGLNNVGQLGVDHFNPITEPFPIRLNRPPLSPKQYITSVVCGYNTSILLSNDGKVFVTGQNYYGEIGIRGAKKIATFTQIKAANFDSKCIVQASCGVLHSVFLTSNAEVYVCGNNGFNQCGIKDHKALFLPTRIPFEAEIKHVHCSENNSFFVSKHNEVYACGKNEHNEFHFKLSSSDVVEVPTRIPLENLEPGCRNAKWDINVVISGFACTLILLKDDVQTLYSIAGKKPPVFEDVTVISLVSGNSPILPPIRSIG